MRNIRKGSASYIVLGVLEKAVDVGAVLEDFIGNTGFYAYGTGSEHLKKSALAQALNRLKEGGLVEEVKLNDKIIFKLTSAGQDMIGGDVKYEQWDRKWRIVSFDIPEEKRVVRNLFRRNLKKWGFKYLHKSVWITKRDVYEKLRNYIEDLGIQKWVTVIEADRITTIIK